jgi:hypothetical protein
MWPFVVYKGKDMAMQFPQISSDMNVTAAIMFKLTEPLLHNGYTIWFDNL